MTGRMRPHYGFRVAPSMIPMVEITRQGTEGGEIVTQVVKVKFGLSTSHAVSRALKWMHENGDPR